MGLFRCLFAIAVIIQHTSPIFGYSLLSSYMAVWSFFIVSGFYMSLVLNEKYVGKNGSYRLFISNRFLRIYPLYLVVLVITFIVALYMQSVGLKNPLQEYLAADFSPLWHFFNVVRSLTLIVGPEYFTSSNELPNYLFLSQSWTLQLELLFYLVAPFLLRNVKVLFASIVGVLLFNYLAVFPNQLFYGQPIIYKFLESIIFFLLGGVSYQIYRFAATKDIPKKILLTIFSLFLFYTLFYHALQLPILKGHTNWDYYLLFILVLPFLFLLTKKNKLDAFIGDLSYPLYISHVTVALVFTLFARNLPQNLFYPIVIIIATTIVSILLAKFIERPIDSWRQHRLKSKKKAL